MLYECEIFLWKFTFSRKCIEIVNATLLNVADIANILISGTVKFMTTGQISAGRTQ